jgi:hypothetical protein
MYNVYFSLFIFMRNLLYQEWLFIGDVLVRCNCPYKHSVLLPLLQSRNQVCHIFIEPRIILPLMNVSSLNHWGERTNLNRA